MKVARKRLLKISAALLGAGIIAFLLFLASAFLGNPVSGYFAKGAIHSYVTREYPELKLEIGEVRYNFKFGEYYAEVSSPESPDTRFIVSWKGGKCGDNYESAVLDGWNTMYRLTEECSERIRPLLSSVEGLEKAGFTVIFSDEADEIRQKLEFDIPFQEEMSSDLRLSLRAEAADPTLDEAARLLKEAHCLLKENGYRFAQYGIDLQNPESDENRLFISDVTPEMIETEDLPELFRRCEGSDLQREGEPFVSLWPKTE